MLAWDIDNAVSLRLLTFDREVAENNAKRIGYEVAIATWGKKEDDVLDSSELHEAIRNDPYADANTIIS